MSLATILCVVRGHQWSRWATRPGVSGIISSGVVKQHAQAPYGERKCKRCGKSEIGAAPKKRKPNGADTVTGINRGNA